MPNSQSQAQQLFQQANKLLQTHRYQQAADLLKQAIQLAPKHIEPYCLLGVAYMHLGQLDQAHQLLYTTTQKAPNSPFTHYHLANFYHSQGDYPKAIEHYQFALRIAPNYVPALRFLATAFYHLYRIDEAIQVTQKALKLQPDPAFYNNLGMYYSITNRLQEGYQYLLQGQLQFPQESLLTSNTYRSATKLCLWDQAHQLQQQLHQLTQHQLKSNLPPGENPFICLTRSQDPQYNFRLATAYTKHATQTFSPLPPPATKPKFSQLNIGYLSYDFNDHVITHHTIGLFQHHRRDQFKIFAYSYGPNDQSHYRQSIQNHADVFRDLSTQNFRTSAHTIQQDNIHILIDLTGHTIGNRLNILALHPAPIQINYLGFPGTIGGSHHQYILTDPIITPPKHQPYYSETHCYLGAGYQISSYDQLHIPPPPKKSSQKLPTNAFIFSSFNQTYKITQDLFQIWIKLLKHTPHSVLWLGSIDASAQTNLLNAATSAGLKPNRLIFADRVPLPQHLARLSLANLALDTPAYNGGATTSNALFAGVPVITTLGNHYPSRMSSSFLTHLGLTELITHSANDYYSKALHLSQNPAKLARIKSKLLVHKTSHPLFNSPAMTKYLESAYQIIWQRHHQGKNPKPLHINPPQSPNPLTP